MTLSKPILLLSAAVMTASAAFVSMVSPGAVIVAGGTTPIADALACDMAQYKSSSGLTAAMDQNVLTVAWNGQNGSEMRTRYASTAGSRSFVT